MPKIASLLIRCQSARIARNLYVDDKVVECNDLDDETNVVYGYLDFCKHHPHI